MQSKVSFIGEADTSPSKKDFLSPLPPLPNPSLCPRLGSSIFLTGGGGLGCAALLCLVGLVHQNLFLGVGVEYCKPTRVPADPTVGRYP
jgi:hypothetical protein